MLWPFCGLSHYCLRRCYAFLDAYLRVCLAQLPRSVYQLRRHKAME